MFLVGLTGGIGSGKSTVAAALAGRGAAVVDADAISREIMEPGGLAYGPVVERFGPGIVGPDGRVDRAGLAAVVFNDPEALAALNGLTHPAIAAVMAERATEAARSAEIVVLDIPLLSIATSDLFQFSAIVVVDAPEDVAVTRLVAQRAFTEADARARIAVQMSREDRRALADFVINNSGDREDLEEQVDRLWEWLTEEAERGERPGSAGADGSRPRPEAGRPA